MKLIRYETGGEASYGALQDDGSILGIEGCPFDGFEVGGPAAALSDVRVLSPVDNPAKVIGVGLNYVSHIEESGMATPEIPMLFVKPTSAVIAAGDPIVYPTGVEEVEYEAELVAVIGKTARNVSEEDALDYVLGYTCGNDVSARAIQRAEMAMGCLLICKGFDTFAPMGPVIATDIDPSNLAVKARLNGEECQNSNTSDLLFSVPQLVSYISKAMTLLPGDVIFTGTPAGVGPIAPGDVVEIEVEGVGVLRNPVEAEG